MDKYLVSYELGCGIVWGMVAADSPQEITAFLPELDVWAEPPRWITIVELAAIHQFEPVAVDADHALDELLSNHHMVHVATA